MIIYISASRQQRIIVAAMHWLQVKTMPIQNIAVFVFETSSNTGILFKIDQKKQENISFCIYIWKWKHNIEWFQEMKFKILFSLSEIKAERKKFCSLLVSFNQNAGITGCPKDENRIFCFAQPLP